jgi:hypothetical protein
MDHAAPTSEQTARAFFWIVVAGAGSFIASILIFVR